ncbi:UMF1 family MFS transporter [Pacificibacter maritimus]|uniref:UMF1 family MFS transporter n=1 Tax=Pacificibacter maritimus TaxID=762213 RepID=A0A3N4UQW5_9RHOB|nr:MFS transporter [Pacificibacter maritimus]RPE63084.1 UMF1 family MFS transporter [Pacificibacter maritimus]
MTQVSAKKRITGWMMYDWATQPFHTLVITFVFAPFFAEQVIAQLLLSGMEEVSAKAQAQSIWGSALTVSGVSIAIFAPILGAIADRSGRKMPWIWAFSALYVIGSAGLWLAMPNALPTYTVLGFFILGIIGLECTTIFTNAILPSLGTKEEIGKISGTGWAWGYVGGFVALVIMLLCFAENSSGVTLANTPPLFGLDPETRQGSRFVGPFTALWFVLSMIPFFLWVRDAHAPSIRLSFAVREGLTSLTTTLKTLPARKSMFAYLASSMFYRDALNGVFAFGGIYALGVLNWSTTDIGIFGILTIISGAIFTFMGGRMDAKFGPKPVIMFCILVLIALCIVIMTITPTSVLLMSVDANSPLPDVAFYICGIALGAVGGIIQSASRTMMVRQSHPDRMTEAFGLFALSGKATSFLAPALIGVTTALTNSQRLGITPLIGLFLIGLLLLVWVKPDGEEVV